jgi:enamine deaminase RidA (YjgF/YER057c/UK114 family)
MLAHVQFKKKTDCHLEVVGLPNPTARADFGDLAEPLRTIARRTALFTLDLPDFPASTLVEVIKLARDEFMFEIEAIAVSSK